MNPPHLRTHLARLALLAGALLLPVALTACNTTEGVGEDLEAAGDSIDDAAEDAN